MNKDSRYYILEVKIKVYNMMDNGGDFFDRKKTKKKHTKIWENNIELRKWICNDQEHCKIITIGLRKE